MVKISNWLAAPAAPLGALLAVPLGALLAAPAAVPLGAPAAVPVAVVKDNREVSACA